MKRGMLNAKIFLHMICEFHQGVTRLSAWRYQVTVSATSVVLIGQI